MRLKHTRPLPKQAACTASINNVLSNVEVESAREGKKRYGLRRYLSNYRLAKQWVHPSPQTHNVTIKPSRDPSAEIDLLRSFHIRDRLHALIPSHTVQNKGDSVGDNGRMVEKSDSSIGD